MHLSALMKRVVWMLAGYLFYFLRFRLKNPVQKIVVGFLTIIIIFGTSQKKIC